METSKKIDPKDLAEKFYYEDGKLIALGTFPTAEEAHNKYTQYKEELCLQR